MAVGFSMVSDSLGQIACDVCGLRLAFSALAVGSGDILAAMEWHERECSQLQQVLPVRLVGPVPAQCGPVD